MGFIGEFPRSPSSQKGVKGACPLQIKKEWPGVSGAAVSALTRTERCKKIYVLFRN